MGLAPCSSQSTKTAITAGGKADHATRSRTTLGLSALPVELTKPSD